jgi:proline iminopeptidase
MKTTAGLVALATAVGLLLAPAANAGEDKTYTRAEITKSFRDLRKVLTPNGVEEQLQIDIGGVKQWITVRGKDRNNPILLMIHGGPAAPETPMSFWFQNGWEEYFTVVQWDQRGAGKTYNANDPAVVGPTLSLGRIVEDSNEVVDYLRQRYGKQKVFVLGHSWGSLVGLSLAQQHPEKLYAYVGMGQVINGVEGERVGYEWTLKKARDAGNAEAVKELQALEPYPEKNGDVPLDKINIERKWSVFYGGLTKGRDDFDYYGKVERFSPDYRLEDVAGVGKGSGLSLPRLLPYLASFNFTNVTKFKTPIVIFAGRNDYTTPSPVAAEWFKHVQAPKKKIVWFEESAHMMQVEEPGKMLVTLVQDVRPLAPPTRATAAAKR